MLEGVPLVAACLDGTLVDADDEASRDLAVVDRSCCRRGHLPGRSRASPLRHGEPDDEDDSREGDAHHATSEIWPNEL